MLAGNTNAATGECPKVKPLPDNLDNYVPPKGKVINCYSEFLPVKGYRGRPGSKQPGDALPAHRPRRLRRTVAAPTTTTWCSRSTRRPGRSWSPRRRPRAGRARRRARQVTWKVNGTRPLAAQVRILLSTDGGKTWKHVAGGKTANDGSARSGSRTCSTSKARIMVEAVGNYFYAVNDKRFRIG